MDNEEKVVEEVVEEVEVEEVEVEEVEVVEEEVKPTVIMVGDVEYSLDKTGKAQAEQVSSLLGWLGNYGGAIADKLIDEDGNIVIAGAGLFEMLKAIGEVASPAALIELFVVVTGCSEKDADEYFDIITLIDGAEALLQQEKYVKVINRFFSTD